MSDPDTAHARAGFATFEHLVAQDLFLPETTSTHAHLMRSPCRRSRPVPPMTRRGTMGEVPDDASPSRAHHAVVNSDAAMSRDERLALRSSVCALWVCAWMAVLAFGPQRALAGSDTWADITDVTQYVPLAWAAVRTLHAADAEGAFQLAAAGITTVGTSEVLKRAIDKKRPNYEPGGSKALVSVRARGEGMVRGRASAAAIRMLRA